MHTPFQLVDVLPTLLEATGARYRTDFAGRDLAPLEGRSMLPALRGKRVSSHPLYWEHIGHAALRKNHWKLVREFGRAWELYDIEKDPTERINLAAAHPDLVRALSREWERWSKRVGVIPFEVTLAAYKRRGLGWLEAAG